MTPKGQTRRAIKQAKEGRSIEQIAEDLLFDLLSILCDGSTPSDHIHDLDKEWNRFCEYGIGSKPCKYDFRALVINATAMGRTAPEAEQDFYRETFPRIGWGDYDNLLLEVDRYVEQIIVRAECA
jgi:hypothetical protein